MFDLFNPALRGAKRRAKEEYKQRMLQGKIDEAMRHAQEKARTELMAKITYTKWKLRKEEEKEYHLKYGVYLKLTTSQIQEDEFFEEMEWRMRKASLEYAKKQAELEAKQSQEERAKIEHQAAKKVIEILEDDFR